jgi:hypothetical protein
MQWDGTVVGPAVAPAVVLLVLLWLSKAALRPAPAGELRYSRAFTWFSLALTFLPALGVCVLVVLVRVSRPFHQGELSAVFFMLALFLGLGLPLVLEFVLVRHTFDEAGLTFRSPWSRHRHVGFADVASLRWRKVMKWLDLRTSRGDVAHLSPLLSGLGPFAEVALRRIPPEVLAASPAGRAVLQLMVAGAVGELAMSPLPPEKLLDTVAARGSSKLGR